VLPGERHSRGDDASLARRFAGITNVGETMMNRELSDWVADADRNGAFLDKFADRLPAALQREHRLLVERLRIGVS
jgi:hypothetical protein